MSEKTRGFSTSIYVSDRQAFEECKRLLKLQGRSLSEEIMNFVLRRLDDLRGTVRLDTSDEEGSRKYEELKAKHKKMQDDFDRRKEKLKEHEDYWKAIEMLRTFGMLADMSDTDEIIPKFTAAWPKTHTDQGFMHEFISLVELSRDKKQVEQRLSELRTASEHEPKDLDVATMTLPQPAMATGTPQQNKEKPLAEEEESRDGNLQEDEHKEIARAKRMTTKRLLWMRPRDGTKRNADRLRGTTTKEKVTHRRNGRRSLTLTLTKKSLNQHLKTLNAMIWSELHHRKRSPTEAQARREMRRRF
jgi:vacuolar-type H+-ATPase subunit I/STV1